MDYALSITLIIRKKRKILMNTFLWSNNFTHPCQKGSDRISGFPSESPEEISRSSVIYVIIFLKICSLFIVKVYFGFQNFFVLYMGLLSNYFFILLLSLFQISFNFFKTHHLQSKNTSN